MMKRYRFGIDFNTEYIVVPAAHEHKEGEWVEANIAEEMYETLLQIEKDFLHNYPADQSIDYNTFLKLTGVLQKARGE